jgi:hypothetical protein
MLGLKPVQVVRESRFGGVPVLSGAGSHGSPPSVSGVRGLALGLPYHQRLQLSHHWPAPRLSLA